MAALDESIDILQTGHISDHQRIHNRLNAVIDVTDLDYGTSAAGIQAAVSAAITNQQPLYVPAGTYALGSTTIYATTDGTAAGNPGKLRIVGDGTDKTIFTYTGSGPAFSSGTSTNTPGGAFIGQDFAITGAGSTGNARGLYLKRYQQTSRLTNVKITGFAYANLHLYRCYGMAVEACHFTGSAGWQALFDNCNGIHAYGGTRFSSASGTGGGLRVFWNDGAAPFDEAGAAMAGALITGCLFEDNGAAGLSIERASAIAVLGNYFEANDGTGQIIVTGAADASRSFAMITGNRFQASGGTATSAVYVDYGEVWLHGNQSFNHTTAFCEHTANARVKIAGHRDGTREAGADKDAAVLSGSGTVVQELFGTFATKQGSTTDLRTALINLGLYTTGGASPLNLNGGKLTCDEAEIDGALNHDGSTAGFYGTTPAARPSAYTQTYATATRTHSNLTSATLTDNSAGVADTTVAAMPDPADAPATADALRDDIVANLLPALRNNIADLTAQVNALRVDLVNAKGVLNQVIDDQQTLGLLQ